MSAASAQTEQKSKTSTSTASVINDDKVVRWRLDELKRAGYSEEGAAKLGNRGDVDLHVACDVRSQGCPEDVALGFLL